ncbi:MAG TPA: FAD-dependent oxidoreductase [bacterium]|nr:FAD-dependent oxidoreductase [bacterium]HNS48371.1 FAD-dependent oxidoreductase [bacterium]
MEKLIIIGGGPAGLTAGLYAGRAGLAPLILERLAPGGQLGWAGAIENYPGFPGGIGGLELAGRLRDHALQCGARIEASEVLGLAAGEGHFRLSGPSEYEAAAVIVAAGSVPRPLGVPGETELTGRGVSYCATCDGPFFRGRRVAVVGGGNLMLQEALFLSGLAAEVKLVVRAAAPAGSADLRRKLEESGRVEVVGESAPVGILGKDRVTGLQLRNLKSGEESQLEVDGVFIFAGVRPGTGFLPPEVKRDAQGYLETDERMGTALPGLFACGDCRRRPLRQVVSACAEGALAAVSAQHYLEELSGRAG